MFITGVNGTGNKLFSSVNNTGKNLTVLPVSMTPAINPCHGFSVIGSVIDTAEKLINDIRTLVFLLY
jgi:hypothetical protein